MHLPLKHYIAQLSFYINSTQIFTVGFVPISLHTGWRAEEPTFPKGACPRGCYWHTAISSRTLSSAASKGHQHLLISRWIASASVHLIKQLSAAQPESGDAEIPNLPNVALDPGPAQGAERCWAPQLSHFKGTKVNISKKSQTRSLSGFEIVIPDGNLFTQVWTCCLEISYSSGTWVRGGLAVLG